jgi:cobalt/nickel transport system permease protein
LKLKKASRSSGGFLEKTIASAVALLKSTVADDDMALRRGLLQQCDPRFKMLSLAVLLAAALFSKSIPALAVLYAVVLGLTAASSIRLCFFLKRTWFFIPLFSLFIAVPALFHGMTPGEPLWSFKILSWTLTITRQGVSSASIFLIRVLDSVSLAVLLVLTTRHHALLKALRVFKVPQLFVMTLGMTYRYIYLLLDVIGNAFTAVKSRVGFVASAGAGRRVVASNMAGLWLHSYRLQTLVYDAMLSRGYTGESIVLDDFHSGPMDWIVLAVSTLILIGMLCLN